MKTLFLILVTACLCGCATTYEKNDLVSPYKMREKSENMFGVDTCYPSKVGDDFHMHGFIPNLPVSFGRIDYDSTGKAHLGGAMTIGYSLMYLWASGTVQSDKNWFLSPQFGIGLTGNFGAIQDPNNQAKIVTAASLGVILGFSSIAFTGQYDFLTKHPAFGVSQTFNAGSAINKATAFGVVVTKDGCE